MIYFLTGIEDNRNLVKIGHTSGPIGKRVAQLQTGSPSTLGLVLAIEGDRSDEAELHSRFRRYQSHGEWFFPGPEIVEFIRNCMGKDLGGLIADILADQQRIQAIASAMGWSDAEVRNGLESLPTATSFG